MRELAILAFQTLDGVMQSPGRPEEDPSNNFQRGGWAANYWEPVMDQVQREAMAHPYDILFGRKTYELFAPHSASVSDDNPVAKMMNSARKYVVTSTLTELEWHNSIQITGDIAAEISRLKTQNGPLIQVHGSCELIQLLSAHDLIDEYRLWTFPVAVGDGKRLFSEGSIRSEFQLARSDTTSNGVVMGMYRRAG